MFSHQFIDWAEDATSILIEQNGSWVCVGFHVSLGGGLARAHLGCCGAMVPARWSQGCTGSHSPNPLPGASVSFSAGLRMGGFT